MSTVVSRLLNASALTGLLAASVFVPPVVAGQVGDKTFFDRVPRLVRTATDNLQTYIAGATYEFTLSVPADAGAPLEAVTIAPDAATEFDVSRSVAYVNGSRSATLASVGGPQSTNSNAATIVFDPPIQPGQTVTISLKAQRNPDREGTRLFGITAYPAGENGVGQFLGFGRLTFYSNAQ
ncbi:DUF2808 domain-containing protein [Leptolyngbya sp. FACHB-36]|uniref:DUF2808 domain-containing protein n=1 Tax=Leptolyngbya sp. FACHB-36 TaxID=2692808 RepID=UPI00167FF66D|nr:DUF2808 domain-containing protein [Leptolyngbya sp. FACHB-36]MBD2020839.1 DUF2808 domain-containing protein [Leptolyngbya sp. FACHB-36]